MLQAPFSTWQRLALLALAVGLIFVPPAPGWAQNLLDSHDASKALIAANTESTPFPTGFLGHPLAYAAAIFGQLLIATLALMILFLSISSLDCRKNLPWGEDLLRKVLNSYHYRRMLIMAAICCGCVPNAIIYLSWGEVSVNTMAVMFTVEKVLKFSACVPFTLYVYYMIRGGESQVLGEGKKALELAYQEMLWKIPISPREQLRAVVLVAVLAIGVTYAKASGL